MNFINKTPEELKAFATEYNKAYTTADPFPNIYFDNFSDMFIDCCCDVVSVELYPN